MSSGDVQQSTVDLTKGRSLVPLQHLTVSPPKHGCDQKKEQIQKKQMSSTVFKKMFLLLCSTFAAQSLQLCLQGLFWEGYFV